MVSTVKDPVLAEPADDKLTNSNASYPGKQHGNERFTAGMKLPSFQHNPLDQTKSRKIDFVKKITDCQQWVSAAKG